MHPIRLTCLSLFVCVLLGGCTPPPEFSDSNGASGRFDDFRGRWLVINYWATWCKPCVEEIPELNHLANRYADRVVVLGVDFDKQQDDALQQAIAKLGINFPVLLSDPSATLGYDFPQVLPTTYLIDPDGKLHQVLKGPQTLSTLAAALKLTETAGDTP